MDNNAFPREDSKELLNLVLTWLGVKVKNFKLQHPGAMSHARFQMQSIYSMNIVLLSKQVDFYSEDELEEISSILCWSFPLCLVLQVSSG
jgi:primosomal replication protein N